MATTKPDVIRAMVDANLLIAGLGWPRFPYEVLQHGLVGDFKMVLTPYILDEARRHIQRVLPQSVSDFENFLTICDYEVVPTPPKEVVEAQADLMRDIADVPIAVAAIQSGVDFLITQDRDFTDHDDTTQKLHEQLKIILPGTFLRQYMGWSSEALEAIRHRQWSDL